MYLTYKYCLFWEFSPDGNFLLSGGQDGTVRLWSMHTKTNLVAYIGTISTQFSLYLSEHLFVCVNWKKSLSFYLIGHSYPIWQVKFCSLGFYFATASYDRTARLWSTNQLWPLRVFAGHLSDVNVCHSCFSNYDSLLFSFVVWTSKKESKTQQNSWNES
jgi:transcription initiation factor TFIID subunit 5